MSGFKYYVWDPVLIISQILAMQASFYLFLGLWVLGVDRLMYEDVSLSQLFDPEVRTTPVRLLIVVTVAAF